MVYGGVWMYGTLVAAAGLALSDMTEGGCGYGVRWCMVYADEVVYVCMAP